MALAQDAAAVFGALSGTGGADSDETGTAENPETGGNQEEGTLTPGDGATLKNRILSETGASLPTLQQATPPVSTQAESSLCEKVNTTRPTEWLGVGEGAASTEPPKDESWDAITTSGGPDATKTSAGHTATTTSATTTSAGHVATVTNAGHNATKTSAGHTATTTSAGSIATCATTGSARHVATMASTGHVAMTTTGHNATTTSTGHVTTTTSAGHVATMTSTGHDATTTSAWHVATTTSTGHVAIMTSAGHVATTTTTGHNDTTTSAEYVAITSTGQDATTTRAGHVAITNTGHVATTTSTGQDATTTRAGHVATTTNQTVVTTKTTTRISTSEPTKSALDKELEALLSLASADPPPHDVLMIQSEYSGTTDIVKADPRLEDPSVTEGKAPPRPLRPATTWTSANLREFKHRMANEKHGLLTVRRGEVMTVRVPTHPDGKRLCWEFATDDYDIGFGIYFDWTPVTSTAVTLQVSESSDEEEEDAESPWHSREGDVERGSVYRLRSRYGEIMQVYRRDSHREVQAGNHEYPGEGVYLLKLDNSYSLLRNKTLYFHVYYSS